MSQSFVFNSPCEDDKYSIYIKDEPLDALADTGIDSIKHDNCWWKIKDEIDTKDEPLESIDGSDFDLERRSSGNFQLYSSNLKVCVVK